MPMAPDNLACSASAAGTRDIGRRRRPLGARLAVASLAASMLTLSACGGGGDAGGGVTLDIAVAVNGAPVNGVQFGPGVSQNFYISAGQSLELDANEPVVWTLEVGGTAITGSGSTVYYSGASITETALSPSRIAIDTFAAYPLTTAIPMTLTATSTIDAAQVATINILITN